MQVDTLDDRVNVVHQSLPPNYSLAAKSFLELVLYLFSLPGVKSFLSQRICQDPLEKFFGCQRQRGDTPDNPTSAEFLKTTRALSGEQFF